MGGFFSYNGHTAYETESTWADSVTAKVGLMYMHDFFLAYPGGNPQTGSYAINAWVHLSKNGTAGIEALLDRAGYHGGDRVYINWTISKTSLGSCDLNANNYIRPVFYLDKSIKILNLSDNTAGTSSNPYLIEQ